MFIEFVATIIKEKDFDTLKTFRAITAKSPKDYFRDNNFINNHFLA